MREIVVNTGPVIALVAATGSLAWLPSIFDRVFIPWEVIQEIKAGGKENPESNALGKIKDLVRLEPGPARLPQALINELDPGEASVIHFAIENRIQTVAIDEKAGRRIARIHGLQVTGSIGILLKAKRHKIIPTVKGCFSRMRDHGIWIAPDLVFKALQEAGEN